MKITEDIDSDFLAMVELTKEIGFIVQNSINQSRDELNPDEIEHVMKLTSYVITKLKKQSVKLTVDT
jgi:hypothetical protein